MSAADLETLRERLRLVESRIAFFGGEGLRRHYKLLLSELCAERHCLRAQLGLA